MPISPGAVGEPRAACAAPAGADAAEQTAMDDLFRREGLAAPRAASWGRALRTQAQWLCGAPWPDVPQVRDSRLTGMLHDFDAHGMHAVCRRLWQAAARRGLAYGHVGPQQVVVLRDAALVRQLLSPAGEAEAVRVTEAGHGPFDVASRVFGDNVFTSHGEAWRKQRDLVAGAFFDLTALRARQDVLGELTAQTVAAILAHRGPVNWSDAYARFTLEAVGRAAFASLGLGEYAARIQGVFGEAIELSQNYRHALRHALIARLTGRSIKVPCGREATVRRRLREMMEAAVLMPNAEAIAADDNVLRRIWRQAGAADGVPLACDAVVEQGATILLASHETTASLLTWATYELMRHPSWVAALRDEQAQARAAGRLDLDAVRRLRVLDRVVREVLRLHPPALDIMRVLEARLRLRSADGDVVVPAGTNVFVCTYENQRDPAVWGADAEAFRPERFATFRPGLYEFMPFGQGTRRCAGNLFALTLTKMFLTELLTRGEFCGPAPRLRPVFRATLKTEVPLVAPIRAHL